MLNKLISSYLIYFLQVLNAQLYILSIYFIPEPYILLLFILYFYHFGFQGCSFCFVFVNNVHHSYTFPTKVDLDIFKTFLKDAEWPYEQISIQNLPLAILSAKTTTIQKHHHAVLPFQDASSRKA